MKSLVLLLLVQLTTGLSYAQQTAPVPTTESASPPQKPALNQSQSDGPELTLLVNLSNPEKYGMAFLSFESGKEGLGFMITPSGKIGTVPMSKLAQRIASVFSCQSRNLST